MDSAVPIWCFPPPVPLFVGHSASPLVSVLPYLLPLLHLILPCASCQGCSGLLVTPGTCAGEFDPSVTTARSAVSSPRAQLGAAVWSGVTPAGTGSATPVSLTWLLSPSVSVLPFLVHPPLMLCVQRCPSPSQCPVCCTGNGESHLWDVFGEEQQ